ncbi:hypothetical protein [Corallococcus exercitus]|uniref:hypothetical protein n=1 Tax=Corallococcus exercitus TaxID=2316736 RepID=UPI0035D45053
MLTALRRRLSALTLRRRTIWDRRKEYLRKLALQVAAPDDELLRDVDLIAWERLEHAYGGATDVPDCLRIAAHGDDDEREDAQAELQSNIFHQQTLYPATVFAVPFLIRMATAEQRPDRPWLLDYLRSLAEASDHVHGAAAPGAPTVREAVSTGLPAYRRLLESEDERVREAAGSLVASCIETSLSSDWWRRSPLNRQRR